ncbi:MAG TPA: HepT-like ribonuclease domain-containing protein [Reyranella sp.]|nr:HepT-like ribonuclease domain-containing protein [Reyranella sp.]
MAAGDSLLYLTHRLDNIERIRGWTDGMTIEAYQADTMLRDATERCLERISEASRRLSDDVKAGQPQIPWRKVADIGNVLRHEYHDVADTEVWRIVVDDLSELQEAIKALMQKA